VTSDGRGHRLRGMALVLVVAFSWGLNWPVLKYLIGECPPFVFRTLTGAIGMSLMFGAAWMRGERLMPPRGEFGRLAVTSVLNLTSWVGLATISLIWLDATEATIIGYTMPIWAVVLAWAVLGERPTLARIAGLVLGFCGVWVLLFGLPTGGSAPAMNLSAKLPGIAAILGTALMFASGAVFTKRKPVHMGPAALLAWQIGLGSLPVVVGAIAFERWDFSRLDLVGWGCIAYVSVIALCVAYLAWFYALRLLPAGTAATGTLLVPVVGVASSALLLGEPLGLRQVTALGLTVAGVALAARG
jgi:probable blue pigment (indigoidine) exporter